MKLVNDFFNNAAKAIDSKYFPNVKYYRDDENCTKVHYALELFNNGVLGYSVLITRLAKACNATKKDIHAIISTFVEDFGGYTYK